MLTFYFCRLRVKHQLRPLPLKPRPLLLKLKLLPQKQRLLVKMALLSEDSFRVGECTTDLTAMQNNEKTILPGSDSRLDGWTP